MTDARRAYRDAWAGPEADALLNELAAVAAEAASLDAGRRALAAISAAVDHAAAQLDAAKTPEAAAAFCRQLALLEQGIPETRHG